MNAKLVRLTIDLQTFIDRYIDIKIDKKQILKLDKKIDK